MDTHSLERTSPKGGPFIGRCVKCGKTDLPSSAVHEECPNPSGTTRAQDILNALVGNQPSAYPTDTEPSAEATRAAIVILADLMTRGPLAQQPYGDLCRYVALALDRFRAVGVREAFEKAASECAPERFISEIYWHDRDTARLIERRIRRRIPGASPMTDSKERLAEIRRRHPNAPVASEEGHYSGCDYCFLVGLLDTATRRVEALEAEVGRRGTSGPWCFDCGRDYAEAVGFPDLVIPDTAWKSIAPINGDGLLCPSCLCKRLHDARIECEGRFTSGPLAAPPAADHTERAREVEHADLAHEIMCEAREACGVYHTTAAGKVRRGLAAAERAGAEKMRALDEAVIEAARLVLTIADRGLVPPGQRSMLRSALAARDAATDGEGR